VRFPNVAEIPVRGIAPGIAVDGGNREPLADPHGVDMDGLQLARSIIVDGKNVTLCGWWGGTGQYGALAIAVQECKGFEVDLLERKHPDDARDRQATPSSGRSLRTVGPQRERGAAQPGFR